MSSRDKQDTPMHFFEAIYSFGTVGLNTAVSLLLQDSHRDTGSAGEKDKVCHLSGDLLRPQGPVLPPRLLPGVHPAAATATTERPGVGVSPVP